MDEHQDTPLYNQTFNLHQISPIYHKGIPSRVFLTNGSLPSDDPWARADFGILARHADHFEEILRGDVIRGIQVNGASDDPEADGDHDDDGEDDNVETGSGSGWSERSGLFLGCRWIPYIPGDEEATRQERGGRNEEENEHEHEKKEYQGVRMDVVYEKMIFSAFLLGISSSSSSSSSDETRRQPQHRSHKDNGTENGNQNEEFTSLPLLLIRMPRPLKNLLIEYLSSTFDTRISNLRFTSGSMTGLLEGYFTSLTSSFPHPNATEELPLPLPLHPRHPQQKRYDERRRREVSEKEQERRIMKSVRDVHLTLAFPQGIVGSLLRSLDIGIPGRDVFGFWKRSRKEAQSGPSGRRTAGKDGMDDVGGGRDGMDGKEGDGFISSISEYLMTNLAFTRPLLPSSSSSASSRAAAAAKAKQGGRSSRKNFNLRNDDNIHHDNDGDEDGDDNDEGSVGDETGRSKQGIAISKIICGGFSIWGEGRIKITAVSASKGGAGDMRTRTRRREYVDDEEEVDDDDDDIVVEGDEDEEDIELINEFARGELILNLISIAKEGGYLL